MSKVKLDYDDSVVEFNEAEHAVLLDLLSKILHDQLITVSEQEEQILSNIYEKLS